MNFEYPASTRSSLELITDDESLRNIARLIPFRSLGNNTSCNENPRWLAEGKIISSRYQTILM